MSMRARWSVEAVTAALFVCLLIAGAFLGAFVRTDLSYTIGAMFVFAMAKGIRMNYLPAGFKAPLQKAYNGMIKEFVKQDANGQYHFVQAVAGAGLGGTPYRDGSYEYYVNEPKRDDDLKAIGPFIQACIEMELLKAKK